MSLKRRKGYQAITALVLFSIAQLGVQVGFAEPTPNAAVVVPQQFIAKLTTKNNQPITVNGLSAATGASIVTGAVIETGADQAATVNLGPLGSLDIAPNTKLVLTYDENGNVKVTILFGCAIRREPPLRPLVQALQLVQALLAARPPVEVVADYLDLVRQQQLQSSPASAVRQPFRLPSRIIRAGLASKDF